MEFIKKNYEKIILSVVLLGLVGVLVLMWLVIMADKARMEDMSHNIIHAKVTPLPDLDLSRQQAVIAKLKSPPELDLTATNKLFNPVMWVRDKDKVIKVDNPNKIGPNAAVVTKTAPLYFVLTLDEITTNQLGTPPRYKIGVERQASPVPALRRKVSRYVSTDDKKKDLFTLEAVKGSPANPDELDFKLADTGETAAVSVDHPFRRVDGYLADLKYPPVTPPLSFNGQRVGDHINFASEDYNIIAITQNEVILLAQSNQKKYVLRFTP